MKSPHETSNVQSIEKVKAAKVNLRDWSKICEPTDAAIASILRKNKFFKNDHRKLKKLLDVLRLSIDLTYERVKEEGSISEDRSVVEMHVARIEKIIEWLKTYDWELAFNARAGREFKYGTKPRISLSKAALNNLSPLIDPWFLATKIGALPEGVSAESTIQSAVFSYNTRNAFVERWVKDNPEKRLLDIVGVVKATLEEFALELRRLTPRGGAKPGVIEPHVVMNLAIIYEELGRDPNSTVNGEFQGFAEDIIESFGLSSNWVATHLRKAIREWKKVRDKTGPEKN